MTFSSKEAWSDLREQLSSKALGVALTSLREEIKKLDGGRIQAKRVPQ